MSNIEDVLIQVRAKLRELNIKLWLPPYLNNDELLENLGEQFASQLALPQSYVVNAIKELQNNAIDKLLARDNYEKTGTAVLKVRVPATQFGTQLLHIEINLDEKVESLECLIAEKLKVERKFVRAIASGKILNQSLTLKEQDVYNNQQIMALISTGDNDNGSYAKTARIKKDAEQLVNDKKSSYLRIEDQDGRPIYLPDNERKSLMLGLALYEKGRASLKLGNHSEALLLFLEADQEMSTCQSKLLESVDNYALLNLDIVWCYLCLKSVTHLPDAERRLRLCEDSFMKTYGSNLERVINLKKHEGNEKALIMRLHLLQAILYYHMNSRNEAEGMLLLAESELKKLKVDDTSLSMIVDLGYEPQEARIALRAVGNDVNAAINEILERRQIREEARKKAKENQKLLGGNFSTVNPNSVKSMMDMGFDKSLAAMALEKANGDIETAIQILQDEYEELQKQLINRIYPKTDVKKDNTSSASTSAASTSNFEEKNVDSDNSAKKQKLIREAYERFKDGFNNDDDNYLDLSLELEEKLILEYKQFLGL